jgi:hypothetical protein
MSKTLGAQSPRISGGDKNHGCKESCVRGRVVRVPNQRRAPYIYTYWARSGQPRTITACGPLVTLSLRYTSAVCKAKIQSIRRLGIRCRSLLVRPRGHSHGHTLALSISRQAKFPDSPAIFSLVSFHAATGASIFVPIHRNPWAGLGYGA